ncbi:hypothetical protein, partial [Escherichia coli]|uniref:hypothetical protein n=1 Tax=Escherichia coli TaxID=562 RepID=UPI00207B7AC5
MWWAGRGAGGGGGGGGGGTAPEGKRVAREGGRAGGAKPARPGVVGGLQSALNALGERKGSLERIKQYQEVIDNYPK